jgi:predicted neuraminidase
MGATWMLMTLAALAPQEPAPRPITGPGVVHAEFIYTEPPTPQCHASTIVETPSGLVAAWFGGEYERHPDVRIWVSRHSGGGWSTPVAVADGIQTDGSHLPTWNPVLFQPAGGPLMLFYKEGPSPSTWWGEVITSTDNGQSWSEPTRLPDGVLGPIKNKPVQLDSGVIVSPSSTEDHGWQAHIERSTDGGKSWQIVGPLNDGKSLGAIQPAILRYPDGRLQAIGRTQQNKVFSTESRDEGLHWTPLTLLDLPNPNSGIDAVTLADGRQLLVYNHTVREDPGKGRGTLNVALSDDGRSWRQVLVLEDSPGDHAGFSYPAVIQTRDGLVHITYTWLRTRVRHVVLDPAKLQPTAQGR